ncbi:hypothetical protein [Geminicoccus harenae]|uniref:hypothetical protein n=2 Tax=Geminicoccus harenae TaxID=2498453 RepID=UPI001C96C7B0|nr:hypothetical protein [Geminicoccus harenae]
MRSSRGMALVAVSLLAGACLAGALAYPAHAAVDLGNVEIRNEGWRYNMTVIREQARTNDFKAQQYADYLVKYKINDDYVVAYAKAVAAKFGTPLPSENNRSAPAQDPILKGIEVSNSGWRYNMTIIREQARTSSFKAQQYADYLAKHKITDAYVVAYAKAVAAKFGTPMPSEPAASPNPPAATPAPAPTPTPAPAPTPNQPGSPTFVQDPILNGIEVHNAGWRYNMTIIREQARTSSFKAQQYAEYLAKHKITDAYVVAYAKALAAKFGTPLPSEPATSPQPEPPAAPPASAPTPTPPPAQTPNQPGSPTFVQDPILNGIEVSNSGWRYNLTVMKKLGEYSAERQATYEYWRDKNRVTDAYVDAYAAAVAQKYNPDDVGKDITVTRKPNFTVYRGFRYHGMPSLANCGLSTDIRILYHDELFGGASKNVPNVSHLKNKIVPDLLRRNVTYVMIDIEHWNAVTEMDKLITVVRTLKEGVRAAGNTRMQFGYYMLVPERNYLAPTMRGSRPDRWDAWMATNEQMRRLAAEVDVIFPSLYTPYENRQDWLTYARANIAEARKYNKPVIPVLWPQYHDTTPGIGTTYLPIKFWEIQMKEVYNISDSVVIWGSVAFQAKGWDNWDKTREWWPYTRKFAADYTNVPQNASCAD